VERIETKVPELDLILGGGFIPGSVVIFAGAPGTGKTILAQHLAFSCATPDHKALYYTTLSETHSKLMRHLEGFDFFDPRAFDERVELIHISDLLTEQSDNSLAPFVNEVVKRSFELNPRVVVIDSAKALRDFMDEQSVRKIMYELTSHVSHTGALMLLLGEYTQEDMEGLSELSLADGIIRLTYDPREPLDRRTFRVVKLRGSDHLSGKHSLRINSRGIQVFPRIEAMAPSIDSTTFSGRVTSGIDGLDRMMRGGFPQGDASVILGASGVGKTVVNLSFIRSGLDRGERCLYASFQEKPEQLVAKAAAFGWDFASALESGQLQIHHVPQDELNLDIMAAATRSALSELQPNRVALDSLAELVIASRESERFPAFARSLINTIREAGATLVVSGETTALGPPTEPPIAISYLFHNVVLLRYIEIESELRRSLNILKMRDSNHDKGLVQCEIDSEGFHVLGELKGLSGVLGWSALRGPQAIDTALG
jgi:circadian clock protein KaiC